MAVSCDLKPLNSLVDPKFESYKLSLTKLPIFEVELQTSAISNTKENTENVFAFEKVKAITLHNHLHIDPYNDSNIYYIDVGGHIIGYHIEVESCSQIPVEVAKLDQNYVTSESKFPGCLTFSSATKTVVSDGAGTIYVFDTGNREKLDDTWKILYKDTNEKYYEECILISSIHCVPSVTSIRNTIGIVLSRFEGLESGGKCNVITQWIILEEIEKDKYDVKDSKTFTSKSVPFYANIIKDGSHLYIGCVDQVEYTPDWSQQVLLEEEDLNQKENITARPQEPPAYTWTQNLEEVIVEFILPENTNKKDIVYSLSASKINIGLRGETNTEHINDLLCGYLHEGVDAELSTWEKNGNKLQVTIHKKNTHNTWPCVVDGDERGVYKIDPEQARIISDQLSKYTSESEEQDSSKTAVAIDPVEECDKFVEPLSALYCFSDKNKFTHKADLSTNHWLFNCVHENELCLVLRHDVDGIIWSCNFPLTTQSPFVHKGTFNALGFIHASKRNLKYGGCSSSCSYAALCEEQHRIYVYHQPSVLASPLRNRKTGQEVDHIAKQNVVTLPSNDLIIGFQATNDRMFVLTEKTLFIIKMVQV